MRGSTSSGSSRPRHDVPPNPTWSGGISYDRLAALMIRLLNRYSYLITSALVMGAAWLVGARFGGLWPSVAVAGTGIGMALLQRRLRGGSSNPAALNALAEGTSPRLPLLLF